MTIREPEPPHYTLNAYIITPVEQLKQLKDSGFDNIKFYSKEDGKEIMNLNNISSNYLFVLSQVQ